MIENNKYYIFTSVKKYKDMMDLIVLYAAKSIFSINNGYAQDMDIDDIKNLAAFAIGEKYRITNLPGYKWWVGTIKYDRRRKWEVPKSVYDLISSKYKNEFHYYHGFRIRSRDNAYKPRYLKLKKLFSVIGNG